MPVCYAYVFRETLGATGDPLVWTFAEPPVDGDSVEMTVGNPATEWRHDPTQPPAPLKWRLSGANEATFGSTVPSSGVPIASYMRKGAAVPSLLGTAVGGSAFYRQMRATAQRLIRQFGQDMELHYKTGGTYDSATRTKVGETTTITGFKGFMPRRTTKHMAGSQIEEKGERVLAVLPVVPGPTDYVKFCDDKHEILAITVVDPGGLTVLTEMRVAA